jgi:hypothetical protein
MSSRRRFLQTCGAAALPGVVSSAAEGAKAFPFILLGDLHYDSLAHHDLNGWRSITAAI